MSLITLQEYKEYTGTPLDNTKSDSKLSPVIEYVNDYIRKICNSEFDVSTVTDKPVGHFDRIILLDKAPVISIESLTNRITDAVIDQEDYILDPEEGSIEIINDTLSIPNTKYPFNISYTYGYTSVPNAIKLVAYELVTYISKREFNKTRNFGNGQSASYVGDSTIPPHLLSPLLMYRQV